MPYPLELQQYLPHGYDVDPPAVWEQRLREVSPVASNMDHLVFRLNGKRPWWQHPERDQWMLYSAKRRELVTEERAAQFDRHWSELSIEPEKDFPQGRQEARKELVSSYQHYMWHVRGLYVKPFLILQGEFGGTPCHYTDAERGFLSASNLSDDPLGPGDMPFAPFDERVVAQIARRDRFLQLGNDYGELLDLESPDGRRRLSDEAEFLRRQTYLDTIKEMVQPSLEWFKDFQLHHRQDAVDEWGTAPEGLNDTLATWRDDYLETGVVPMTGAGSWTGKRIQVTTT